jgi:hypothetical protein
MVNSVRGGRKKVTDGLARRELLHANGPIEDRERAVRRVTK